MIRKLILIITLSFFVLFACEENTSTEKDLLAKAGENNIGIVPVEAMNISEKLIEQKLPLTGVLKPYNSVDLISEVSGKVKSISKELGDYVSANQILAVIDDIIPESQYKQAQAQVQSTQSALEISELNLKSDKILFENGDISELEYNSSKSNFNNTEAQHLSAVAALSAAKKTYEDTRIKSPISGFVARKNIEFGTMVPMGTVVYRVVDLSNMKLIVSIPQEIINRVSIGEKALVNVSALNGHVYEGRVKRISPQADEATGGFMVEILVPNSDGKIKGGMTAKIELLIAKEQKVIAIPEYALVSKNDESFVYKITNDYAELVKIELGESIGENVIVETGLSIGDKIVVVGMKNLGIKTKVNIEKMN
ncbi:MAG: efflux RND transporter periplasmic adaptor subunit [Melioribacteraceae bacterium]|nr:efflux RND transporter periplasmic adaptor subunit [Melioribacteraceae bacterium]